MDGERWGGDDGYYIKRSPRRDGSGGSEDGTRGAGRTGGLSVGASDGEMNSEPRLSCHVRCGGSVRGVHQQLDSIRWWWMERRRKSREGVIKKREKEREKREREEKQPLNLAYDCTRQIYCHSLTAPRVMQRFLLRFCYENSLATLNKLHMALAE